MAKNYRVETRLDEETYLLLNELAGKYEDNASAAVRAAIREKAERERGEAEDE